MGADTAVVFEVAGRPRPKGSKSIGMTKDGRAFLRESGFVNLGPWQKAVKAAAKAAMAARSPMDTAMSVVLTFRFDRPASHGDRLTWPTGRTVAADVDKATRAVLDCLSGIVYVDDSLVVSLVARKQWGPAGVHVWVNHAPGTVD